MTIEPKPVLTSDDAGVRACTGGIPGVEHDYRRFDGIQHGRPHTWLRCVFCHGVSCGDADEPDPCIEPYHHRVPHRSRFGVTWPIGGTRP